MLALTNISLRRGRKVLIENASFQIHAGQRMGVIGANGCGKSSLFAMLLGELEPDDGELALDAKDEIAHVAQESPHSSNSAVDYVMDGDRELREVQAAIAAGEAAEDEPDLHLLYERMEAIDGFTAESRASRLLHGLGFSADEYSKSVREFSGGWRMRLNLARALMCRSDILLLDEPTNHLDLPAILWLERWLRRYEGILLVVSHDRDFLDQVCTRIGHIENETIKLVSLRVCCETGEVPNASMTLNINGVEQRAEASGDGPVDACFKAIDKLTAVGVELQLYSVNAITTGTDSQGEVTVRVQKDGQVVNGQGADTDVVIASAKSYINALNKVINGAERTHPQRGAV